MKTIQLLSSRRARIPPNGPALVGLSASGERKLQDSLGTTTPGLIGRNPSLTLTSALEKSGL